MLHSLGSSLGGAYPQGQDPDSCVPPALTVYKELRRIETLELQLGIGRTVSAESIIQALLDCGQTDAPVLKTLLVGDCYDGFHAIPILSNGPLSSLRHLTAAGGRAPLIQSLLRPGLTHLSLLPGNSFSHDPSLTTEDILGILRQVPLLEELSLEHVFRSYDAQLWPVLNPSAEAQEAARVPLPCLRKLLVSCVGNGISIARLLQRLRAVPTSCGVFLECRGFCPPDQFAMIQQELAVLLSWPTSYNSTPFKEYRIEYDCSYGHHFRVSLYRWPPDRFFGEGSKSYDGPYLHPSTAQVYIDVCILDVPPDDYINKLLTHSVTFALDHVETLSVSNPFMNQRSWRMILHRMPNLRHLRIVGQYSVYFFCKTLDDLIERSHEASASALMEPGSLKLADPPTELLSNLDALVLEGIHWHRHKGECFNRSQSIL